MLRKLFAVLIGLVIVSGVAAQDAAVPDLTGLSVPEAAAALNRVGFKLGAENNQGWTAESGLPQNTISGQSIPAGQAAAPGTAVDVNVLRSPNVVLLYDDNDLTLVNNTGGALNAGSLTFRALDGSGASFGAGRWGGLAPGDCGQVWSVGRGSGKDLPECGNVMWMTTNDPAEHFWTGAGGTTQFGVFQDGLQRGMCAVSNPGRCEFFVSGGAASDATAYVYFAYTPEHLAIINTSTNQWMVLDGFSVSNNYAPPLGAAVNVADPTLYKSENVNPAASIGRLAPGQCILYTNGSPGSDQPPQPCDVIARLDVGDTVKFWGADFGVNSSDGVTRSCPAAVAGKLTLCIMPR